MENENVNVEVETEVEQVQQKTYTQEEVLKLLQSESDRRVSQALNKQKKEYEKKLSLSQLDESARGVAEKDMKIQELEEKLRDYTLLQNKNEVVKVLNARGLNPAFADLVEIGEDAEEAQAKIETLDKLFKDAVATEVKKRLANGVPKEAGTPRELTEEDFHKMNMNQKAKLYRENPELFRKFTNK